jgi:hypothetical protein
MHAVAVVAMLGACATVSLAHAESGPWPTALSKGSDCAAWTISAKKTEQARRADRSYCEAQNPGDESRLQACVNNANAKKQVEFFTNRCGSDYVIALDGRDWPLKRLSPATRKPPYLTGRYAGDGVRVTVESPRLLSKEYEAGEARTEANVVSARYAVKVRVVQGRRVNRFPGELWYGR